MSACYDARNSLTMQGQSPASEKVAVRHKQEEEAPYGLLFWKSSGALALALALAKLPILHGSIRALHHAGKAMTQRAAAS